MTTYRYSAQQKAAILAAAESGRMHPGVHDNTRRSLIERGIFTWTRQGTILTEAGKAAAASLRAREGQ